MAINKHQITQLLKILTVYAVGLLLGAVTGFLPLFSIVAGFPIIIVRQKLGLREARITALACLLLTWVMLDPLSFIFVGLGVSIGYSLLAWRSQVQTLGSAYKLSFIGGAIWLAASNWSVVLLEKRSLLAVITEVINESLTLLLENATYLELYSPEQMKFLQEFKGQAPALFSSNWPMIAFVFISLGLTACLFLVARYEPVVAVRLANWRNLRAPAWLAIATIIAFVFQRFAPETLPFLVSNTLAIGSLVLLLSGYALVYFYMRHLRFSRAIGVLFTFYLLLSLWLRPVLVLIGQFDALFDYRHFARAKGKPE